MSFMSLAIHSEHDKFHEPARQRRKLLLKTRPRPAKSAEWLHRQIWFKELTLPPPAVCWFFWGLVGSIKRITTWIEKVRKQHFVVPEASEHRARRLLSRWTQTAKRNCTAMRTTMVQATLWGQMQRWVLGDSVKPEGPDKGQLGWD